MARFHDFDAAWAEAVDEGPTVRICGEDVVLPAAIPAKVAIFMELARTDPHFRQANAKVDTVTDLLAQFIGQDAVDRLLDDGASMDRLHETWAQILALYAPEPVEADASGEAKAPRKKAPSRTSSKRGATSRRTSPASTKPT